MTDDLVHFIDPLRDPRWPQFLAQHAQASVFHSREWLHALKKSYGYEPFALTTSGPGRPLEDAIVACRVRSWLTGHRLVSLPFSDHCEPLVDNANGLRRLLAALSRELETRRHSYVEFRPIARAWPASPKFEAVDVFCLHRLDLRPELDSLYHGFHKDCVQRKIRRAEREGLVYQEGTSEELFRQFYELLVVTRRRHGVPTQPQTWFRNLMASMGENLTIRVASKDGVPLASILTLRYKRTMMYKYGGSDKNFSNLGAMQQLLWRTIQDAKRDGLEELDMGRSDLSNHGLIDFKRRWGATRSELVYVRSSQRVFGLPTGTKWIPIASQVLSLVPPRLVATLARTFYRHLG